MSFGVRPENKYFILIQYFIILYMYADISTYILAVYMKNSYEESAKFDIRDISRVRSPFGF